MKLSSRLSRTAAVAAAPLVLLSGFLLAGCVAGSSPDDASSETLAPDGPTEAADATDAPAEAEAGTDVRVVVGPLLLGVPDYWSVGETTDGVTSVSVKGCPDGTSCPTFTVLHGGAIAADVDPAQAYTRDDAACPGGFDPQTADEEPRVTEIVLDGVEGTLTQFQVECVDADGAVQVTVPQLQWHLPQAPGGDVLVVDRWSFDGLSTRIAGAGWDPSAT